MYSDVLFFFQFQISTYKDILKLSQSLHTDCWCLLSYDSEYNTFWSCK